VCVFSSEEPCKTVQLALMVSIVSISDKGKKSARSFKMPTVLLANSQAGEKGEKKDRDSTQKLGAS